MLGRLAFWVLTVNFGVLSVLGDTCPPHKVELVCGPKYDDGKSVEKLFWKGEGNTSYVNFYNVNMLIVAICRFRSGKALYKLSKENEIQVSSHKIEQLGIEALNLKYIGRAILAMYKSYSSFVYNKLPRSEAVYAYKGMNQQKLPKGIINHIMGTAFYSPLTEDLMDKLAKFYEVSSLESTIADKKVLFKSDTFFALRTRLQENPNIRMRVVAVKVDPEWDCWNEDRTPSYNEFTRCIGYDDYIMNTIAKYTTEAVFVLSVILQDLDGANYVKEEHGKVSKAIIELIGKRLHHMGVNIWAIPSVESISHTQAYHRLSDLLYKTLQAPVQSEGFMKALPLLVQSVLMSFIVSETSQGRIEEMNEAVGVTSEMLKDTCKSTLVCLGFSREQATKACS